MYTLLATPQKQAGKHAYIRHFGAVVTRSFPRAAYPLTWEKERYVYVK